MDVLPVSGAGGSRRRYRNGRGIRLGGEHPLSLRGPQTMGGVVWLGVIQRPDRLAFSRVYASVSTVLSARAFPRLGREREKDLYVRGSIHKHIHPHAHIGMNISSYMHEYIHTEGGGEAEQGLSLIHI